MNVDAIDCTLVDGYNDDNFAAIFSCTPGVGPDSSDLKTFN